jgi:plastocyanin
MRLTPVSANLRRHALLAAVLATAVLSAAYESSAATSKDVTITTRGKLSDVPTRFVVPNKPSRRTLYFSPGAARVRSGGTLTLKYADKSDESHTVTIFKKRNLPKSFDDRCRLCRKVIRDHQDPDDPDAPPAKPLIDVGREGLDREGDSLYQQPKETVSATVSARRGAKLYYLCALHPWMQGSVTVR